MPEINSYKLAKVIQEYLKTNNVRIRALAKRVGISHSYMVMLKNGIHPRSGKHIEPTMDVLSRLAKAMNIPLTELLFKIGYLEKEELETISLLPSGSGYVRFADKAAKESIPPEILEAFVRLVLEIKNS